MSAECQTAPETAIKLLPLEGQTLGLKKSVGLLEPQTGAANLREITNQGDSLHQSLRLESCHAKAKSAVPVLPPAIPANHAAVPDTHRVIPVNLRAAPAPAAVHP